MQNMLNVQELNRRHAMRFPRYLDRTITLLLWVFGTGVILILLGLLTRIATAWFRYGYNLINL